MFKIAVAGTTLLVVAMTGVVLVAAFQRVTSERLLGVLRRAFVALWALAWLLAGLVWIVERDWVHELWAVGIPLTFLLFVSGPILMGWASPERTPLSAVRVERNRLAYGRALGAMTLILGALPLVLVTVMPVTSGRNIGDALGRVAELAMWGFGGPLPEALVPTTAKELARGVGHLPREVSLPVTTLLQASWVVLIDCALGLAGRCLPGDRVRRTFLLLAPVVTGTLLLVLAQRGADSDAGVFDARLFVPILSERTGSWTSDPATLRSFGPLLLLAVLAALLVPPLVAMRPSSSRVGGRERRDSQPSGLGEPAEPRAR